MKKIIHQKLLTTAAVCLLFGAVACNNESTETNKEEATTEASSDMAAHATATLEGTKPDTAVSGTVQFDVDNGKVKMTLDISVPTKANQVVAVHIHETGACGDMGKAAGGHWNPSNQSHGKWGSASFHAGDIGNINLDANGKGTMTLETDLWSIGGEEGKNILNHSIIVHGGADDYTSQPSGNAGERIGCGVIQANKM